MKHFWSVSLKFRGKWDVDPLQRLYYIEDNGQKTSLLLALGWPPLSHLLILVFSIICLPTQQSRSTAPGRFSPAALRPPPWFLLFPTLSVSHLFALSHVRSLLIKEKSGTRHASN